MTTDSAFHVVDGFDHLPESLKGGVVAIGNFDGLHRGHQAVIAAALEHAHPPGGARRPAILVTFEPHPRAFFRPEAPIWRLTPAAVKARLARALGLDAILVVPFTAAFAAEDPETFVAGDLVGRLGIRAVGVGYDFHFGKNRAGSPAYLKEAGRRLGFEVALVPAFQDEGGETISSSRVRDALADGDLGLAHGLLGWRWFFEGDVVPGDQRGRTIGYPTANVRLPENTRLRHGIYAVTVDVDGRRHQGVASWGRRPTFDDGAPVFETFVFDFAGDLYGRTLRVTPVSYLRPEAKFESVSALVAQMDRDSAEARAVLAALGPGSALDRALAEG